MSVTRIPPTSNLGGWYCHGNTDLPVVLHKRSNKPATIKKKKDIEGNSKSELLSKRTPRPLIRIRSLSTFLRVHKKLYYCSSPCYKIEPNQQKKKLLENVDESFMERRRNGKITLEILKIEQQKRKRTKVPIQIKNKKKETRGHATLCVYSLSNKT